MTDASASPASPSSSSSSPAPRALYNITDEFVSRPAREYPEKLAILGTGRPLTYADLMSLVDRVAEALRSADCKPGERVLIALPDSAEFFGAFFGAAKIGAIAVPVNPMARAADYRHWSGKLRRVHCDRARANLGRVLRRCGGRSDTGYSGDL